MWLEANDKWIDKLIIYRIPELKIAEFIRHFFFMKDSQTIKGEAQEENATKLLL